jgi:hypothetical protein
MLLVIPRFPFPHVVHAIPKVKSPFRPRQSFRFGGQRLPRKRLIDCDVPQHNASAVEFEFLEVYRPRLRPVNAIRQIHL